MFRTEPITKRALLVVLLFAGCGGTSFQAGDPCTEGAVCQDDATLLECKEGVLVPRLCGGDCDVTGADGVSLVTCSEILEECSSGPEDNWRCEGGHRLRCGWLQTVGDEDPEYRWHWYDWCEHGCIDPEDRYSPAYCETPDDSCPNSQSQCAAGTYCAPSPVPGSLHDWTDYYWCHPEADVIGRDCLLDRMGDESSPAKECGSYKDSGLLCCEASAEGFSSNSGTCEVECPEA